MAGVYVVGIAMTVFGRQLERSLEDMAREALDGAVADANCNKEDIGTAFWHPQSFDSHH